MHSNILDVTVFREVGTHRRTKMLMIVIYDFFFQLALLLGQIKVKSLNPCLTYNSVPI